MDFDFLWIFCVINFLCGCKGCKKTNVLCLSVQKMSLQVSAGRLQLKDWIPKLACASNLCDSLAELSLSDKPDLLHFPELGHLHAPHHSLCNTTILVSYLQSCSSRPSADHTLVRGQPQRCRRKKYHRNAHDPTSKQMKYKVLTHRFIAKGIWEVTNGGQSLLRWLLWGVRTASQLYNWWG